MEFIFETFYNDEALAVMAKSLRKTARKKKSIATRIYSIFLVIFAILVTVLTQDEAFVINGKIIVTWLVTVVLALTLIFEDKLNAYVAKKRMLPGLDKSVVVFKEEGYFSETPIGKSEFKYDTILFLAETKNYFVFLFSKNHAQVYDKRSIQGGTVEEFRDFIVKVTENEIQNV